MGTPQTVFEELSQVLDRCRILIKEMGVAINTYIPKIQQLIRKHISPSHEVQSKEE